MASLLTCCTIIAVQQLDYMRAQPMGFDKEQVISIPVGNQVNGREALQRLRNKLAADPTVLAVTGSGVNIGKGKDRVTSRTVLGFSYKDKQFNSDWLLVDYDYLKTLNIPLLAGREFNPSFPSDSLDKVIITASAAEKMGEKNPVGMYFRNDGDKSGAKFQVIGVVPDFHLYSLKNGIMPITMHLSHNETVHYIFVRMRPQNLKGSMDKMKNVWREMAPQAEFKASFLDENVNEWYHEEELLSYIFSFASGIAILVSCLGLFAVALFISAQRTKEIGIRKVLGAGIPSIVLLLSKDFVKMVIIALSIAVPLAWFFMQKWLENYSYHIQLDVWVFVGVGMAAILITLITISFQSIKVALTNPVNSLRSE
jgi:ABC-type antimicrobial peptide transport system permease subunit